MSARITSVFKKAEFWTSLTSIVSGLLMAFGVITQEQADGVSKYIPNIIGAIISIVSVCSFNNTQHSAKVEVFRAMCALSGAERVPETKGEIHCMLNADTFVCNAAKSVGL